MKLITIFLSFLLIALPQSALAQTGYAGSWQTGLQEAVTPIKAQIDDFHQLLLIIVIAITVIITALLLFAAFKFRRRKHVEPATFAHNTLIEVLWTIVPVVILIIIAIPSFKILYFEDRIPEPELSIKVTGYQWYWGYEYMDYEGLEFLSYMIAEKDIDESIGQRRLLSTDNPVIVPVGVNIEIVVTAADVLHSFALPAAGIKRDAVPGRLNLTWMRIDKPGTYYGQCSEICGTGHAYMPIEIIAVPRAEFDAWVASKGGTLIQAETDASLEAKEEVIEDLEDSNLGNDPDENVQNSETQAPDSIENKLNSPNVEEENISNPGL